MSTPPLPALVLIATLAPFGLAQQTPSTADGAWRVETFGTELPGGTGGVDVDRHGNVYVADFGSKLGAGGSGGNKLFKMDPSGKHTVFADTLRGGSGNAFGPNGDFFQSSIGGHFITRITPEGKTSIFANTGLRGPVGIAIDEEGMLFVSNCGSNSIAEITPDGEVGVYCKSALLSCPNGITIDPDHNLYVANFNNGDVIKIDWESKVTKLCTLPGNNNGHLIYHENFLYVVARGAHQIFKVSLDGKFTVFAGSGIRGRDDGPALEATFSFPNDIGVSPDGKFFYVNHNASITEPHTELAPMLVRRISIPAKAVPKAASTAK